MRNKIFTITFIATVILFSQLLTQGPNFLAAKNTPSDKWFTGQASWFDPWDVNIYFSAIGWGKRGGWFFENVYDTSLGVGIPIYTFYTLTGKIAKILSLENYFSFHLAAIFSSLALAAVVWKILGAFLEEKAEKLTAFALVFLGGGLGWLLPFLPVPDLALPGFTMIKALNQPHEAISLGLFLAVIFFSWQMTFGGRKRINLFWAGLSCFLMLLFHPYSLLPLGIILSIFGVYWWLKTSSFVFLYPLFPLFFAAAAYFLLTFPSLLKSSGFSGLLQQQQTSSSPLYYLAGWGVFAPLAALALFSKKKTEKTNFVVLWFILQWLIVYFPFGFQRLLVRGLWVAVAILATKGLRLAAARTIFSFRCLASAAIIFSSLSGLSTSYKRVIEPPENRWIYLTKQEGEAIEYLKTHGENEEGVLASYRIGNIIPGSTAKRVYVGHEFQTPNFYQRITEANSFFANQFKENEAKIFLSKAKVSWVFWGPDEKAVGGLEKIPYPNLLEPVFEKEKVIVYKVKQ